MPTPTSMNFYSVTGCYERTNKLDAELQGSAPTSAGKPFGATLWEVRQTANGHNIAHYGGNKLPNSNLQKVMLGPQVNIIMPEGPPPDDQSLLAFARSQGIDGGLIQQILNHVVAGEGGDAELEIPSAELTGEDPQACESLAVLFQPLGVGMPLAGVAMVQPDAELAAGTRFEAGRAGGAVMPNMIAKPSFAIHDALAATSTVLAAEAGARPVAAMAAGTGLSVTQISLPALSTAQLALPTAQAVANVNPAGDDQMILPLYGYTALTPAQPGTDALRADGASLRAFAEGPSILPQVDAQVPAVATEARALAIATGRGAGVAKLDLPELGARAASDPAQSAAATAAPTETSAPRWDAGARLLIDLGGTAPDNQESMNDANFRRSEQYQLLSERLSAALGQRAAAELGKGNWQLTLHLNPAYLGRIDVRLGRRASGHIDAEFSATQRDTQDLLQNGMGRLREIIAASGVDMRLLDVRHEDSASGGHPQPSRQGSAAPFATPPRADTGLLSAARTHIDYIGRDGLDVMA